MFSSNPFGQSSSSSPFGSQSAFGQPSNSNNPFAPKPFGSTTPFGAQTGGSIFGGTSTGVFGTNQPSSTFSSTPAFGASSSPAFGSSVPAFGATSTPSFGGATSAFGGSSLLGQQPAFCGFGSPSPASPFGSSSQPSQPAFGSNLFGSSPAFGASSQPAFGASSQPAFGGTSTPAFGSTSTPAFGASAPGFAATGSSFGVSSTPAFGATTSAFGSTVSAFGSSTGGAFGASSSTPLFGSTTANAFGATSTPLFGAAGTPAFGASSTPAFGATSTPGFGASSVPAFGASSSPSFSFGSSPTFGQSTAAFGSSPFGSTSSPFGSQPGTQATTPTFGNTGFGQSPFGGPRGGSRVAPYAPTTETDSSSGTQPAGKLESISAMPAYKDKSHEELRWEDYQLGDKGGPNPAAQSGGAVGFGATSSTPAFSQSSPFGSTTTSNPFGSKPFGSTGFGSSPSISAFNAPTASTTPSPFGSTSTPAFGATQPSIFSTAGTSAFGSTPSLFSSLPGSSSLNTGFPTQSTPLFSSTTQAFGQPGSGFGQTTSSFGQTTTPFGQTTSAFGQTNIFSTPSTGFSGNIFSSTPSLVPSSSLRFGQSTPSFATSFQPSQPAQATNAFGFGNLGQTQIAGPSFSAQNVFGQSNLGNTSANLSLATVQPAAITNPFGTLPAMPQISIGKTGTGSSIQYGIASMPVVDKPAPVRISSLLTSRHVSQRRIRLPVRKYRPKNDGPKVPFFSEDEEMPTTPKADALFVPRENPRALIIRPIDQWPSRTTADTPSKVKNASKDSQENEPPSENGLSKDQNNHPKEDQKPNGVTHDHHIPKGASSISINGHRAGEAAIAYEYGADIEALMPKLRHSDYYTEPRIQELAAKERAEPGFCRRVPDFVIGRHGFGSIKFIGETDVRRLDLESLVQFNNREVIVYMDETKKPPVGQGLNKPAVVTLLNIKCRDRKTGRYYTEGPKAEKYKETLKKKTEDQGAEFVSYDPEKGEWTFKVMHFSRYLLDDDSSTILDTLSASPVC
ncbi:hypothetical protein MLD38_010413 [Melastoma candidum]|uniref:Uncharacterized protein n=1 Tax=Melastoma candidum TaxID=119954 RepID=A0ACB9R0C0_9MYRT|nr:hypothetical protein MLD38_010413 [Melastoma candidum]